MYFWTKFLTFTKSEDGAVTVDFVVLTAAVVVLGVLTVPLIINGTVDYAQEVEEFLVEAQVDPDNVIPN